MPLPEDTKIVETSEKVVDTFKGIFGSYPGIRPAHAKGALLTGLFTPSPLASTLSSAPHFTLSSTPITARFSSSTGIPAIPDNDPNAQPRGLAIRFHLPPPPSSPGRRVHTDIITHGVDAFPASTPAETLAFFSAIKDGSIAAFLESHPAALKFIQTPKPFPVSFGTEKYFSVNAFTLTVPSESGTSLKKTHVRYRIIPTKGTSYLSEEELKQKSASYLFDNLTEEGTLPIEYKLVAQVANLAEGDITSDNTAKWPETRELVELGTLKLDKVLEKEESDKLAKTIIFDPIPRVEGVEASDDPLLELRAGVYLISGRERRLA